MEPKVSLRHSQDPRHDLILIGELHFFIKYIKHSKFANISKLRLLLIESVRLLTHIRTF